MIYNKLYFHLKKYFNLLLNIYSYIMSVVSHTGLLGYVFSFSKTLSYTLAQENRLITNRIWGFCTAKSTVIFTFLHILCIERELLRYVLWKTDIYTYIVRVIQKCVPYFCDIQHIVILGYQLCCEIFYLSELWTFINTYSGCLSYSIGKNSSTGRTLSRGLASIIFFAPLADNK